MYMPEPDTVKTKLVYQMRGFEIFIQLIGYPIRDLTLNLSGQFINSELTGLK